MLLLPFWHLCFLAASVDPCPESLDVGRTGPVRLVDYEPYPWTFADDVKLEFTLNPNVTVVGATLNFQRFSEPDMNEAQTVVLNASPDMRLVNLRVDGKDLLQDGVVQNQHDVWKLCVEDERHLIVLYTEANQSKITSVSVESSVEIYPWNNTELFGLYESDGLLVTQNEALGFRRITPFPDRPDVSAIFDVTITGDKAKYPVILSNGNLVSILDNADGTQTLRFIDPFPKPCYLFALVAGELEAVEKTVTINLSCVESVAAFHEISISAAAKDPLAKYCDISDAQREGEPRDVDIKVWGKQGTEDRLAWALDSVYKAMLWDEVVYGRVYDLDVFHVVATRDFNAGAMENKGLNIFNIALIEATPELATDQQFIRIRGVIAHEYFHNWSGDRVTLRDWFQLTLKEGFTVFRDEVFTEDITKSAVKRVEDAKFMINAQFPQDASPLSHPIRPSVYESIENFYTITVYEKGAEVVRMLQTLLGWRGFRRGTDYYFERYDGTGATCDDFVLSMERASGRNLDSFKRWYSTPGTPVVTVVERIYDPDNRTYSLTLRQKSQSTDGPLLIPIKFTLFSNNGDFEQLMLEIVIELKDDEENFVFEEIATEPLPSILRGFSAPVQIEPFLSDEELLRLAMYDTDGYVRWQAAQYVMMQAVHQKLQISNLPPFKSLLELYRVILERVTNNEESDLYLLSYLLRLPPVSAFENTETEWDPTEVFAAIARIKLELAVEYYTQMHSVISTIEETLDAEPLYDVRPTQVGLRAFKNLMLDMLSFKRDDAETKSLLATQMQESQLETERNAALQIIANYPPSKWRNELLDHYYDSVDDEPVLIDRWLAAQSSSIASDALDRVYNLTGSPLYKGSTTPNRLRALMSVMANNPVLFHHPDGRGYELVANEVIRWDKFNAKIAARLATAFSHGKKLPPRRRNMMMRQVERILVEPDLSINTREIVTKILSTLQPLAASKHVEL